MSFAMSGASSAGKSTLAREIAQRTTLPYFAFPTTELVAELGLSPVGEHDLETRLIIQTHLLDRFWELSQAHARPFITDRSPLDYAGYMLAECAMHNTSLELGQRVNDYVTRALEIADKSFLGIFVLGALPLYAVDPKRPPPNVAYHRHFESLLIGLAADLNHTPVFKITCTAHDVRVKFVMDTISETFATIVKRRENQYFN